MRALFLWLLISVPVWAGDTNISPRVDRNVVLEGKLTDLFAISVFASSKDTTVHLVIEAFPPGQDQNPVTVLDETYPVKHNWGSKISGLMLFNKYPRIDRAKHGLPTGVSKISYRVKFSTTTLKMSKPVMPQEGDCPIKFDEQKLTQDTVDFAPNGYPLEKDDVKWVFYATNRPDGVVITEKEREWSRFNQYPYIWEYRFPSPLLNLGFARVDLPADREPSIDFVNDVGDKFYAHRFAGKQHVVLYVHGYNNSFEAAVLGAAELKKNLQRYAASHHNSANVDVMAFSWPSHADATRYFFDERSAHFSAQALENLIYTLSEMNDDFRLHIVVHSMGNRVVLNALYELLGKMKTHDKGGKLDNVIFAAPDVATMPFVVQAHEIRPLAKRLTLYHSDMDIPLSFSKKLPHTTANLIPLYARGKDPKEVYGKLGLTGYEKWGGRAGECPIVMPGLDSIDCNQANSKLTRNNGWRHTYFLYEDRVLQDIAAIILDDRPVSKRPNLRRATLPGESWEFTAPTPKR